MRCFECVAVSAVVKLVGWLGSSGAIVSIRFPECADLPALWPDTTGMLLCVPHYLSAFRPPILSSSCRFIPS